MRRIHAIAVVLLLLAAQLTSVAHATGHALGDDSGACFICHAADGFKHAGAPAATPPPAAMPNPPPYTCAGARLLANADHGFAARAPPTSSC